jgi:hypothetical protein
MTYNELQLRFVWCLLNSGTDERAFHKYQQREDYKKHRVSRLAGMRTWAKNNRPVMRRIARKYYDKNSALCKERANAQRNSPAGRAYMRKWQSEKAKKNPAFRLEKNIRTRIWFALFKNKKTKSARTLELLGCTVPEFKSYIEKQFESWMTWENYGKEWEIDHIRPCAKFDLADPEQQKACFNFSNQRPLKVFTNRSEGAR